jgi:hypothetical protein
MQFLVDIYTVMFKLGLVFYVESLMLISFSHQDVFYSRKNFKRPDLQTSPHQAFEQEVALLDTFFKGISK